MSNVFSLADRRARAARYVQPAQLEEDDIAFPSAQPEPAYAPEELAPDSANEHLEPDTDGKREAFVRAVLGAPAPVAPESEAPAIEPSGDIQFHADRLELAVPVAVALLAFTSKDTTRSHLSVGIGGNAVCATDGHTLACFEARTAAPPDRLQGKVWSRSHVETAIKVAKARKESVALSYGETLVGHQFPPVLQVMPDYGVEATGAIGVNPEYLGRMVAVAKAVGVAGVRLTSARGELEPLAFKVGRRDGDLSATVVIMPMRADGMR